MHRFLILPSIALFISTLCATLFRASFSSALHVPYGSSIAFVGLFISTIWLGKVILSEHKERSLRIALFFITTAPAMSIIAIAIIMRALDLTTLRTHFNEFDVALGLWLLAYGSWHIIRATKKISLDKNSSRLTLKNVFIVIASACVFIFFGIQSLGNAAYVDERLWTYSKEKRIEKYWNNLREGDFRNTRPSDKPGVTLAILEGPSLLFVTPSDFYRKNNAPIEDKDAFAHMLFMMRLPLVLVSAVLFFVMFYVLTRLFTERVAHISIFFIASSPLLIGMSRIINPDALTWSIMSITLLSGIGAFLLHTRQLSIITGIFLGLALLTKYIATIFFLFFLFVALFLPIFANRTSALHTKLRQNLNMYGVIITLALITFFILYPGVWVRIDRLLLATIWSEPFTSPLWQIYTGALLFLLIDTLAQSSKITIWALTKLRRIRLATMLLSGIFLLISIGIVIHSIFIGIPEVPFEGILSSPKTSTNADVAHGVFDGYFSGIYAIIFGIHPFILVMLIIGIIATVLHTKKRDLSISTLSINLLIIFILLFYVGATVSTTAPMVRYQILLYPLFFIIAAYGAHIILRALPSSIRYIISFSGIALLLFSLVRVEPFFFSYNSEILPEERIINPKDMGDGSYEIAQWLNRLPDAKNLNIWSDKRGVCTFFIGNCSGNIRKRDFIAHGPHYDYFVTSRGRESRTRNLATAYKRGRDDYPIHFDALFNESAQPRFTLLPGGRTANTIKIFSEDDVRVWRGAQPRLAFASIVEDLVPPSFPQHECLITDYGAIQGDQNATTKAIEDAISDCSTSGGGTVLIPAGEWNVGAIRLQSDINLHLKEGAVLSFSSHPQDYLPVVRTRFIGIDLYNYAPGIYAKDVRNVAITGNGTLRGNGKQWPDFIDKQRTGIKRLAKLIESKKPIKERVFGTQDDALRPSFIQFFDTRNILIEGVTITQGPMWTVHFVYSEDIIMRNVTIDADGSNTDGIVLDSSRNARIEDITIASGDDAIAIKSGRDADGRTVNMPTKNIILRTITITDAHSAIAIGSEMSGGVENILAEDITIENANRGIRIKTRPGRGGTIKKITFRDILVKKLREAESVQITLDYGSSTLKPRDKTLPNVRDVLFERITTNTQHPLKASIALIGAKKDETALSDITFRDITMNGKATISVRNAQKITFTKTNARLVDARNATVTIDTCPKVQQKKSAINVDCQSDI